MPPKESPRDGPVPPGLMLQYLVVLAGSDPLVWRRIRVPATYSFWDLHVAIQDSMGWRDYHLHEFRLLDPRSGTVTRLGIPDPDWDDDHSVTADWTEYLLDYTRGAPQPIQYTYDFGDDWSHAVIFEGFEQGAAERPEPQCLGGAGACPLEDSGGPHGYAELLIALEDPTHPEHEEWLEWLGRRIDPNDFSSDDVHFDDPQERWRLAFDDGAI